MIPEKHRKRLETVGERCREYRKYIPIVGMCLLLLLSVVASTAVLTHPVADNQSGTVAAQSATFEDTPIFAVNDNYGGDIVRIDPNNMSVTASHTFSNPKDRSIAVTSNGYVFAASQDTIVKLDTDLNVITTKTYSNIDIRGLSSDVNGNLYVGTGTELRKLDTSFNNIWNNTDAAGAYANADPSVDAKGENVYVAAGTSGVIAVDKSGNTLWTNTNVTGTASVVREHDSRVAVVNSNQKIEILDKSTGNIVASNSFGGLNTAPSIAVSSTLDGGFWVGASAGSGGANLFDSNANQQQSFGGYNVQTIIPSNDDTEVIHSSQFNSQTLKTSDTGTQLDSLTPYITHSDRMSFTVKPEPPKFDEELEIDTRSYLKHGNSSAYEVFYTNPDTGNTTNVTADPDLTINSSNTTVFTLNKTAYRVEATSNTSINARENITAKYTGGVNDVSNTANVTVANATVDNLEILPGVTRVEATYTDSNIVLILIGTMLGVVATRASSAFAGIATIQLVLVAGFFVDLISLGVVLVGLFGALFIGLNLAANIDYTVRG